MAEGHGAALAALRARGADRRDPVRFRTVDALARRAAAHEGAVRQLLDARVSALLAALDANDAGQAPRTAPAAAGDADGALAALGARLAQAAAARGEAPLPAPAGAGLAVWAQPRALDYFRRTWARLSAQRRLTQALAQLPENPGPLNSHRLVHRSLTLMREVSPGYLHRFMAYVDALAALEQAQAGAARAAPAPRGEGAKSGSARGRKAS